LPSASLIKRATASESGVGSRKESSSKQALEPYFDAIKVGCRWIAMSGMRAESRDTLFIP
jgi:hypothetical protein